MTRSGPAAGRFLTAQWRHLVMRNHEVDPAVLRPLVPRGTELDPFAGRHLVSVVGFRFTGTRLLGVPVPLHRDFDEINLRFYVRREAEDGPRRGVVFVKEIVPLPALAVVARLAYGERYVTRRMRHRLELPDDAAPATLRYAWREAHGWQHLGATAQGRASLPEADSEEEFVTEHYWGYAAQRDGGTVEYRVEHPRWTVRRATTSTFACDVARVYGPGFAEALASPPVSTFVADGSDVVVRRPRRLADRRVRA